MDRFAKGARRRQAAASKAPTQGSFEPGGAGPRDVDVSSDGLPGRRLAGSIAGPAQPARLIDGLVLPAEDWNSIRSSWSLARRSIAGSIEGCTDESTRSCLSVFTVAGLLLSI